MAQAYVDIARFDDAWSRISQAFAATNSTNERWEAEVFRVAGEIAVRSQEHDSEKAEAYFDRALAIARQQEAKSWALRASMSLAATGVLRARCSKRTNRWLQCTGGSPRG
jgi:hypothetical protein